MPEFRGPWGADDVEQFLQEVTIPIRIATRRPDDSLWQVTLWYRYRDGCFECATQANAQLVRFLRADSAIAFDVSTNEIPYRGVRGNGVASISPDENKDVLRSLIRRYLGSMDSPLAATLLQDDREEVRISIEPNQIFSWDFSKRMKTKTESSSSVQTGGSRSPSAR